MRAAVMQYFAYGSNMAFARISARVPSARAISVAELGGHVLRFHKRSWKDGSGKCDAFATGSAQDTMYGVLFEIDRGEKTTLDREEGLGNGYQEKMVELRLADGTTTRAVTYYAAPPHIDPALLPFDWYKEFVVHGALEHGLPVSYIEAVRRQQSVSDPDVHRAAENRAVLKGSQAGAASGRQTVSCGSDKPTGC